MRSKEKKLQTDNESALAEQMSENPEHVALSGYSDKMNELIESNTALEKELNETNKKLKDETAFRKKIERELVKSEERFISIAYSIADVIWEIDTKGMYTFCSENVESIYGYSPKEIIGNSPRMLLKPELFERWEKVFNRGIENKKPLKDIDSIVIRKDGVEVHILTNAVPLSDKRGGISGFRGVDKNITKRKKAEEENIRLAAFPRESPHPILSSDPAGNIIFINPAAQIKLDGLGLNSAHSFLPENHKDLISSCLREGKSYNNIEIKVKGHVFSWTYNPVPDINIIHLHGLDITDQKYFEEKLLHDALHDKLTGLPNRSLFHDELVRAIKISKRRNDFQYAVIFMDLGRFKLINDSLGHLIGDRVLVEVAARLTSCLRPEDTAARFGGDEFTVLLNNIADSSDPIRVSERIQKKISLPLNMDGHEIFPSVSIGIVISSREYSYPEDLLRDANTAMYSAKAEGLSRYVIFDKKMHDQAVKQLELESSLRYALERNEFSVYYQPIVSLENRKIAGLEALLRWRHLKRGLITPEEFMHVIEETGQIIPIGEWVIKNACKQLKNWQVKFYGNNNLFVSVNLSAKQFIQPDLTEKISKILEEEKLNPRSLRLEITESVITNNLQKTDSVLTELQRMGVQISIDNFGTGYFSLINLHRFPIQCLNIDRSLISLVNDNDWNSVIPQTIISLAKHLQMDVVAEGVETAEQLNHLKNLECRYAQGNYFSPPANDNDIELLLINDPLFK